MMRAARRTVAVAAALALLAGCDRRDREGGVSQGRFETVAVAGDSVRMYVAGEGTGRPGVVLYHAWWGLDDDVAGFANRLAEAGFAVVAPDLARGRVAATIPAAESLAATVEEAHAERVALAATDRLAAGGRPVGAVGFSLGAAWAVWSAAQRPVAAVVVYYGSAGGPSLAAGRAPVLGHFAAQDPFEPEANVAGFERALKAAGREVTLHRYAGTGHWFAEPSREAFRRAAADTAFERTVRFLERHLE